MSEEYTRVIGCDAYCTSEKEREVEGERGRGRKREGKGGGEREGGSERERERERAVLYLNIPFIYVACIDQLINMIPMLTNLLTIS